MKKIVVLFVVSLVAALFIVGVATVVMAATGNVEVPSAGGFAVSSGYPLA